MSVDSLTDSELRTKLAEYGYPVGPVTQTTRKILVKKLKNLMDTRGGTGSRHSLAARYSSDETDEDTTANAIRSKKKPSASARRQTMANPMPPPAAVVSPAPVASVPRSPGKRKAPPARSSEPKETIPVVELYDEVPSSSSSNRSVTRTTVQKKTTSRTYKASSATSDGWETGSDSDITEEPEKSYYSNKSYEPRARDRSSAEIEHSTKLYETRGKPAINLPKIDKYVVPPFKPNISPILPVREETTSYKKDDLSANDILANYETPYLSEFTRRLSSRSSINLPNQPSRSALKSPISRSSVPESKDGDTNGHFSSLRSYTTAGSSTRFGGNSSNDRSRDVVTRTFIKSSANGKEEVRNNHNMVSMVLVIVLALFFGVLAVMYLGLGGKAETFPSLPSGRYPPAQ